VGPVIETGHTGTVGNSSSPNSGSNAAWVWLHSLIQLVERTDTNPRHSVEALDGDGAPMLRSS
jgi:hypothetical protein